MRFLGTLIVSACVAGAALAQTPLITNPVWLQRPDGETFLRHYPEEALNQNVIGGVTLMCSVDLDTTAQCLVADEWPAGWGFGDAALRISQTFRVRPAEIQGQLVRGGRLRVPLRFNIGDEYDPKDVPQDAEYQEYLATAPQLDLPRWGAAPPRARVETAFPEAARGVHRLGRGVLNCRVRVDRGLRCTLADETPAGFDFGAAALELSGSFRVAASDQEFIARYRDTPFELPINFGGRDVPVGSYVNQQPYPAPGPPREITQLFYPPAARAQGLAGNVTLICTVRETERMDCAIEEENPAGAHFGAAALRIFNQAPVTTAESVGLVPGDRIRYLVRFVPAVVAQPPEP